MSAPVAATLSGSIALTVPAVPTGMKAGVRMTPRGVASAPARARPSRASTRNSMPRAMPLPRPRRSARVSYMFSQEFQGSTGGDMNIETDAPMEGTPLIRPSTTDHPLYDQVVEACRTVFDPEIPVNIFDLGLVYTIEIAEERRRRTSPCR